MARPLAYYDLPKQEHVRIPSYAAERLIGDRTQLKLYGMREEEGMSYVLAATEPCTPRVEELLDHFHIPGTHYTSSVRHGRRPSFELPEWLAESTNLGTSLDVLYQIDHLVIFDHERGSALYRSTNVEELVEEAPINL